MLQCSKLCVSPHSDASLHSTSAKGGSPGNSGLQVPIAASTAPWAIATINTQRRAAKAGSVFIYLSREESFLVVQNTFFCGTATIQIPQWDLKGGFP